MLADGAGVVLVLIVVALPGTVVVLFDEFMAFVPVYLPVTVAQ